MDIPNRLAGECIFLFNYLHGIQETEKGNVINLSRYHVIQPVLNDVRSVETCLITGRIRERCSLSYQTLTVPYFKYSRLDRCLCQLINIADPLGDVFLFVCCVPCVYCTGPDFSVL